VASRRATSSGAFQKPFAGNIGKNLGGKSSRISPRCCRVDYFRVDGKTRRCRSIMDSRTGVLERNACRRIRMIEGLRSACVIRAPSERRKTRVGSCLCARFIGSGTPLCQVHFGKGEEDVFFAGEILKKVPLPRSAALADVFDGGFRKTFARE